MKVFYKIKEMAPQFHFLADRGFLEVGWYFSLGDKIHIKTHDKREYEGTLILVKLGIDEEEADVIKLKCGDEIITLASSDIDQIEV